MNEMEQRSRLKMLDELSKEMDRFDANSFKERGNANKPIAVVEEKTVVTPSPAPGEAKDAPAPKSVDPSFESKPMYQDPKKEDILRKVEAKNDVDPYRQRMMGKGQFGVSRMRG